MSYSSENFQTILNHVYYALEDYCISSDEDSKIPSNAANFHSLINIDEFKKILVEGDEYAKRDAIIEISKTKSPELIDIFIQLLNEKPYLIRQAAAIGLGNIRDERAVPSLYVTLNDKFEKVRMASIWALGEIQNISTYNALFEMLDNPSYEVKCEAIRALRKIKNQEIIPLFMEIVHNPAIINSNSELYSEIEEDIINIYSTIAIEIYEIGPQCFEILLKEVNNDDVFVSWFSSIIFMHFGEKSLEFLTNNLDDLNKEKVLSSLIVLGRMKKPKTIERIKELVSSSDQKIAFNALYALLQSDDDSNIPFICTKIHDENYDIRELVMTFLSQNEKGIPIVIKEMKKKIQENRGETPKKIINILHFEYFLDYPLIIELLSDDIKFGGNYHDSFSILDYLLTYLKNENNHRMKIINLLVKMISSDNPKKRCFAVKILSKQSIETILKFYNCFITLLKDDYYKVRIYAINALKQIGYASAIEPLCQLLLDENSDVRNTAVHTIQYLKNFTFKANIDPSIFLPALQSDNIEIRTIAVQLLKEIGYAIPFTGERPIFEDLDTDLINSDNDVQNSKQYWIDLIKRSSHQV